jgi:hypothetical protein
MLNHDIKKNSNKLSFGKKVLNSYCANTEHGKSVYISIFSV